LYKGVVKEMSPGELKCVRYHKPETVSQEILLTQD